MIGKFTNHTGSIVSQQSHNLAIVNVQTQITNCPTLPTIMSLAQVINANARVQSARVGFEVGWVHLIIILALW